MNTQNYTYDLAEIERKLTSSYSTTPTVKLKNFFDNNTGAAKRLARNVSYVANQLSQTK